MTGLTWTPEASHLFAELMRIGPPPPFRASAESVIRRAAERNAIARNAAAVDVRDIVKGCLSETPVPFRPKMMDDLTRLGVNPTHGQVDGGTHPKEEAMQKIEVNYKAKSDDANRNCGKCVNFQPVPGSQADGTCFGYSVTVAGLCDFYTPLGQRAAT